MSMKSPMKKISIIIPVYNEEANLLWHFDEIQKTLNSLDYNFELIYVDDGSSDDSLEIVKKLARSNQWVRYIALSRNFGKEAATSAGLKAASGDAAILIDADGQHPIKLLRVFIAEWESGYEVVVGVRNENTNEGLVKKYGSKLFYAMLNVFADGQTAPRSTDFRLIDRKVINEFNKLTERNRMTRGLIDWLGFKRTLIEFKASARIKGEAPYDFKKLVRLALHGLVSQTTKPLQITGFLGAAVTLLSGLLGVIIAIDMYVFNDPLHLGVTGTGVVALFISFLVGIVLICQWLLALYIESIHSEAQNRPLYIVRDQSKDSKTK
jgi:glycosyltransferase involved in cell wall biosynthesis